MQVLARAFGSPCFSLSPSSLLHVELHRLVAALCACCPSCLSVLVLTKIRSFVCVGPCCETHPHTPARHTRVSVHNHTELAPTVMPRRMTQKEQMCWQSACDVPDGHSLDDSGLDCQLSFAEVVCVVTTHQHTQSWKVRSVRSSHHRYDVS